MADTSTIASLATVAGTLVLAVATFSSARSANRALRVDHEGGQRTMTRFFLTPRSRDAREEPWLWICSTSRHWNLDRARSTLTALGADWFVTVRILRLARTLL